MVQQFESVMSAVCSEFTENAWRKDLCSNCQRSRGEHASSAVRGTSPSPVPKKRTSVIIKSFGNSENEKNISKTEYHENHNLKSSLKGDNSQSKALSVQIANDLPEIIGNDGGITNLFLEDENDNTSDGDSVIEELSFTEEEREFVLLALENTIWNSDDENLKNERSKPKGLVKNSSREFEDIKILSLWKPERFKDLKDCDAIIPKRYGTFPLRSKSSKSYIDSVFDDETLTSNMTRGKLNSLSSLGSGDGRTDEINDKHDSDHDESSSPYKLLDINEVLYSKFDDVLSTSNDDASADKEVDIDPDEDYFDGFLDDLDLDSSQAGMQLVDMLNDVLAKYSDSDSFRGIEDHEIFPDLPIKLKREKGSSGPPTLRAEDLKALKGSVKSTKEFNVTLANIIKKQKKKPAPKPPTSPPPPPIQANQSKTSPVQSNQSKTLPSQNSQSKLDSHDTNDALLKRSSSSEPNFIEPKFGMVTVGKSIIDHGQEKPLSPKRSANVFEEVPESKPKPEVKQKRGISGFFRNILKRGKDSSESTSDQNLASSDSSLTKSNEVSNYSSSSGDSVQSTGSDEGKGVAEENKSPESKDASNDKKQEKKAKPVPTNPRGPRTSIIMYMSESFSESNEGEDKALRNGHDPPQSDKKDLKTVPEHKEATEPVREKRPIVKPQTAPPPRPQTRPRPPPNPNKPTISPQLSSDGSRHSPRQSRKTSESSLSNLDENSPKHSTEDVVRRRAKSPKRSTAPSRPAVIPVPAPENRHSLFTKELEMRLSKNVDQTKTTVSPKNSSDGTLPRNKSESKALSRTESMSPKPISRSSSESASPRNTIDRKSSLGPPPPSPMTTSTTSIKDENMSKDRKSSLGPPPPSPMTTSICSVKDENSVINETIAEVKGENSDSCLQDVKPVEKIELPNKAQSRRSFLGKLNRKSKAPSRPQSSIKRAKSVSENPGPGSDLQPRKIDLSDISGPVMITDPCGNSFPVSRRNTITIGEDHSLVSGGSTSSGSTNDKYDEWPDFSPLGSLDNLYEPIVPKEAPPPPPGQGDNPDTKIHTYDPLSEKTVLDIPVTAEGYLEPVRTNPHDASKNDTKDVNKNSIKEKSPVSGGRKEMLASQPIYEEINGNERDIVDEDYDEESVKTDVTELQNYMSRNVTVSPSSSFTESDTSSASGSLNRPRPIPRRRPKPIDSSVFEQPYIAMNRPSIGMSLNESQLRETVNLLTSSNLQTLREIYSHYEKEFKKDNVHFSVSGAAGPLKWRDFDIYGKPVHKSERCIVYNAKLRSNQCSCQLMLLHSRPDISAVEHPSLLHPSVVFSDMVPHSYLTEDFIKTNQLLQYSNKQSDCAKCFIATAQFDITDNMNNHLASLEKIYESRSPSEEHLEILLFYILQILSAIAHCLEHGFSLGEANFRDVFILAPGLRCHGNIIAFLPHQKSHESLQVESICAYMEKYLAENLNHRANSTGGKFHMGIYKIGKMLQTRKIESLAQVRCYIEFLLWGPKDSHFKGDLQRESNIEPKLSIWLEQERANLVHLLAKERIMGLKELYSLKHFYQMKFLLKCTAYMLSESVRHHLAE